MKKDSKNIHPLAIVSKDAQIHPSVVIGPFCLIEENVEINQGCNLANNVIIKKGTKIGKNNRIHSNVVIGDIPQDISFDTQLRTGVTIGNSNVIRENVTIHRATLKNSSTQIGDNNLFMVNAHIAHDCLIHNNVIIANNSLIAGHVKIFNYAFVSGNCAIHQHIQIGELVMVGGLTGVTMDVPPYCLVFTTPAKFFSLNLVGLRRYKMSSNTIKKIELFYREYYQNIPIEAKKKFSKRKSEFSQEEKNIYDFIINSRRGIINRKK